MPEVTTTIGLECFKCSDPLQYEEIEVEMIFRIKPCKLCAIKEREEIIKELQKELGRL